MGEVDNRFLKYKRLKMYRRMLFFMIGFSTVLFLTGIYVYEWNRMPEVIYVEPETEQRIDLGVPVWGELRKESTKSDLGVPVWGELRKESAQSELEDEKAVEILSHGGYEKDSVSIDFSKEILLCGAKEEVYYADLKLFGILPYKTVRIETLDTYEVIPSGRAIGIYIKMNGIYVIDISDFQSETGETVKPCEGKLKSGDYIIALDGEQVTRKKDFVEKINSSCGKTIKLTVLRNEKEMEVEMKPVLALDGQYKIGAWIRDSLQGVGTMTYVDENRQYAALGHAVRDADTNDVVNISGGTLYETSIMSIKRGKMGEPGEVKGLIQYYSDKRIGSIENNTTTGIFGVVDKSDWLPEENQSAMKIALKQEIELGEAYIISSITGECEKYNVEIIEINYNSGSKHALTIRVTDEKLLELTGGIVQGMSGSPIIQDGKIIGAVTHVLVNDPTRGYGIFIESMLEHDN